MNTNVILAVPEEDYDNVVPSIMGENNKLPVLDEEGNLVSYRHPTWREFVEGNTHKYGEEIRRFWPYDQKYYQIVLYDASRITDEFQQIEDLRTLLPNGEKRSRATDAYYALLSHKDYILIDQNLKAIGH